MPFSKKADRSTDIAGFGVNRAMAFLQQSMLEWGEAGQTVAARKGRGKSGLHRAGCRLTAGGREAMESATENEPPMVRKESGKGEKAG